MFDSENNEVISPDDKIYLHIVGATAVSNSYLDNNAKVAVYSFGSQDHFTSFTKDKEDYVFNLDNIKIPALNYRPDRFKSQWKNPTDVWYIQMVSGNYPERTSHPAQYPEELIGRIINVASSEGDIVLDPFMGSGTTARVAKDLNRKFVGYDTNPEYIKITKERLHQPIHRKKLKTKDVRGYYFYMDNKTLSEFIKTNGR